LSFILLFILGLIVGSFLNAVIFRLHSGESFARGRSKCVSCRRELSAKDLIPLISFFWLKGKCRYCKSSLSWQYPAVEFITALSFVLVGHRAGALFSLDTLFFITFISVFILIAVFDLKHFLILDKVVFPFLALAFLFNLIFDLSSSCSFLLISCRTAGGLLSGGLASAFFFLQYVWSGGRWIGFGDVKLGLLLGFVAGWPYIIAVLFVSYMLGALVGLGLVGAGKKQLSSKMPFGTFLAASAIIILLYGRNIIDFYFNLFYF
jgi:leader peptidase (prepilin peptidase) / N-methyltransferase